ncbi:hypothetical protein JCM33374_g3885 [Metschnikowia sp. JCM 33374]|nr:hypothetical protein JCM33374_g3885 [Metschnikowia sp. JCM 33374]
MTATSEHSSTSEHHSKHEPESTLNEDNDYAIHTFVGDIQGQNVVVNDDLERQSLTAESLARTVSRKLSSMNELYEEAAHSKEPLPKMGANKPYPAALPDREPYLVAYDGPNDPEFPHNWPLITKLRICFNVALSALSITLGSAMFSLGSFQIMKEFHVGFVVATLGTSLFVFGFASGPIIWGPLSELYGRKSVLAPSIFGFTCFSFATATAKDIQTIMICRFFAGFVGAAPLVVAPASMSDIFSARARGKAMSIFAMVVFGGPMLAPIISGFTVKNPHLGWRWTSYLTGIIGGFSTLIIVCLLKETHHGIILEEKAETLRRRTGNWGIGAPHEEVKLSIKEIVEKNLTRPIQMLFTEPILFLVSLHNAFIYGLLYLFLTAVPLIFQGEYHIKMGVAELPYLSMLVGVFMGGMIGILMEKRFVKRLEANGGKPIPEERLPPMMIGAISFTVGLFWLGWSGSYPKKVHWIVPTIGAAPIGMGLILLFLPSLNYIIDCYLFFAASALAGNTFLRSAFGAAFPLFARQMFEGMQIKWAATLLGCISAVMIPVPFLFYFYGKKIRSKSKWAF